MKREPGGERGIALVATFFVLVVLLALVAGLFFGALQALRLGRNSAGERRAFDAAEAGLAAALGRLDAAGVGVLAAGDTVVYSGSAPSGAGSYAAVVQKLNAELLFVRSRGRDAGGSSERELAMIARLDVPPLQLPAALVSSGWVEVGPWGTVDGGGVAPDGWSCPASLDTVAGVAVAESSAVAVGGCGERECIRGAPAVLPDTSIRGQGVPILGEGVWTALLALADTIRPGGDLGDAGGALRIRYVPGNLALVGSYAEGILLVDGDLLLDGGAQFAGVIVVRGQLRIRGGGGRIAGAAVVGGASLGVAPGGGPASVVYSSCVLRQVAASTARPRPLSERSWAAIY